MVDHGNIIEYFISKKSKKNRKPYALGSFTYTSNPKSDHSKRLLIAHFLREVNLLQTILYALNFLCC